MDSKVAEALIESLPYINSFKDNTLVIKLGGSVLFDPELRAAMLQDLSYLRTVGINVVIVHGGGKDVTAMLDELGRKTDFIDGYRRTDSKDAEIIEMVLSAKVNKGIVTLINIKGGKAVGLSGKDASIFQVEEYRTVSGDSLGQVGRIIDVHPELLNVLLGEGYMPVISSIAHAYDGRTMNINADEAASSLASSLKARKLIFVTDVDGLMLEDRIVDELDLREAEDLLVHHQISGGMIPKLQFSIEAIKNGVPDVHLINGTTPHSLLLELFTERGVGTKFTYSRRKREAEKE